jgi:hypothetical protein
MDNDVNSDFGGLDKWAPYRSTAASNSGEDLSTYDFGCLSSEPETYSSSEGEIVDSSIYGTGSYWDVINVSSSEYYSNDFNINDNLNLNPDMILPPILRIPTSSPTRSPPAQSQLLVDTEASSFNLKRPRAPVAADLDTANILPSEHCRKRMKPARVECQ